jgi:hypothetical protein
LKILNEVAAQAASLAIEFDYKILAMSAFINNLAVNVFIAIYLFFAIFWNSREENAAGRILRAVAGPLVRALGLGHAWNMYSGPFQRVSRIEIRVQHLDQSVVVLDPPNRYEFRRYFFMAATHAAVPPFARCLQLAQMQLQGSMDQVARIEIVKRSWKSPTRGAKLRGRFSASPGSSYQETILASWTRT